MKKGLLDELETLARTGFLNREQALKLVVVARTAERLTETLLLAGHDGKTIASAKEALAALEEAADGRKK